MLPLTMRSHYRPSRTASLPPRVIVFTRGYPPAYLMGGPARSLFALVEALAADFRFSVITSAFDGPDAEQMRSSRRARGITVRHATIRYGRRLPLPAWRAAALLREPKPQLVYLTSFFD